MSKTAASILQELMVKRRETVEYEILAQSGPQHASQFTCRCVAGAAAATATAPSKKEARQLAAERLLRHLAAAGLPGIPPAYHTTPPEPDAAEAASSSVASYVALLKELCEQYRLPAPDYQLLADLGPPHDKQFTMSATVGGYVRLATAGTKRAARQAAAGDLYRYLRQNLARLTTDFNEEEALVRAHEKVMERYHEVREDQPWTPALGMKIADYHLSLVTRFDEKKCSEAMAALQMEKEEAVRAAAAALGLEVVARCLPPAPPLLQLAATTPPLVLAAARARHFLRLALDQPRPQ